MIGLATAHRETRSLWQEKGGSRRESRLRLHAIGHLGYPPGRSERGSGTWRRSFVQCVCMYFFFLSLFLFRAAIGDDDVVVDLQPFSMGT